MASPESIAIRQAAALNQVVAVMEKHDPEAVQRLRNLTPNGTPPNSIKQPDAMMTYLCESAATLARLVDQHLEESKPRPRGRPRTTGSRA